mmetsp:Transcript_47531/g.100976  ORF Transcript_47531/g.100976 Transcript_47531/m.100976 type:complete len:542 (+) Transcript_47531:100-1725(+)
MIAYVRSTSDNAMRCLNFYLEATTLILLRRANWVRIGIFAPRLLLALAFTSQGVTCGQAKNNHANSRGGGERINNSVIINRFEGRGVGLLLGSPLSDATADIEDFNRHTPPEWNALSTEAKIKLADLLSWKNLSKWEFNIVEVAESTSDPLLLVGWALLCEPMAQEAMRRSVAVDTINGDEDVNLVGDVASENGKSYHYHYHFHEHFKINPRTICNFLREIERRYDRNNPFHNNIHAADVTQTTHCLFQLMDQRYRRRIFDPITIFSLILAATFHDVYHPGTNNLFQENAMTPIAIEYNDVSILENMHSAVGHSLLMGEKKQDEWDVFEGWTHDDKVRARKVMVKSILSTDMAGHFRLVSDLKEAVAQRGVLTKEISGDDASAEIGGEEPAPMLSVIACEYEGDDLSRLEIERECDQLADLIVRFLLHSADISNAAKAGDLPVYWGNRVLDEFFEQGDKEKEMGLPISPNCDREIVKRPESQISFINIFVQPLFDLLGKLIPRVKEEVSPAIGVTLEYWEQEKLKSCIPATEESENSTEEE